MVAVLMKHLEESHKQVRIESTESWISIDLDDLQSCMVCMFPSVRALATNVSESERELSGFPGQI